jgi:hypothetical protein
VTTLVIDDVPDAEDLERRLEGWKSQGPITGVYWLPALDPADEAELIDPETRAPIIDRRVKLLYATMRALYDQPAFLISATRLGGRHGYDEAGATDTVGGAVVGFTKAFAREKPESLVKSIDFTPSRKTTAGRWGSSRRPSSLGASFRARTEYSS